MNRELSLQQMVLDPLGSFLHECEFVGGAISKALFNELLVALISFEEEGERIRPNIIVLADKTDPRAIFPNAILIPLGSSLANQGPGKVLKKCARLATDGVLIHIDISEPDYLKFGLLDPRQGGHHQRPRNQLPLVDREDQLSSAQVALVSALTSKVIRMSTPRASFMLDLRAGGKSQPYVDDDSKLTESLCHEHYPEECRNIVQNAIEMCRQKGHGAICIVGRQAIQSELKDATWLPEPMPILSRKESLEETVNEIDVNDANRATRILSGMLATDGATVISEIGEILGYSAFISPKSDAVQVSGGARLRAFHNAQSLENAISILYLSQDGPTLVWSKP